VKFRRNDFLTVGAILTIYALGCFPAVAEEPTTAPAARTIELPKPVMEGGMPLMEALKSRHSSRDFSGKPLSDQVLSNLLWAACGVNRPDGRRTAPSAMNWQEIDVYVVRADGTWIYFPRENKLVLVAEGDLRAMTGIQDFVGSAAVNLVFVADMDRTSGKMLVTDKAIYVGADVGCISQNVYLYCASEGLNTVVRGSIDRSTLAKALNLSDHQQILLAQTVGYPPDEKK
jgi:SagB-type dehydrogenase family enzyme